MKQCLRKLLPATASIFLLLASGVGEAAYGQTFVHPGALSTQADFDRIKAKVATGDWPWYDSYVNLCNDGLTSLNWGWAPVNQIIRGSGAGNNFARSQKDAIAIYCLALRWRISGDNRYADKAIQGMDAWSSTMTLGCTGDNWGLASGLCGYEFAVAGETLRGYSGWSQTSIDNYKTFLGIFANQNLSYLSALSTHPRSNWPIDNMASLAACGVFCDNASWFNRVVDYYKQGGGVGATGNGQVDLWAWFLHPEGIVQMEESGRDQAHCADAIASMAVVCEIASHQGVDLYGYDNNRFLRGAEYFAKYNSGLDVPYTAYFNGAAWPGGYWESVLGAGSRGAFLPVFDMLNTHFVQKGIYAPYTAAYAASRRPTGNIGNWNSPDYLGYDTLTHYQDPPTTDLPPSGLLVNFDSRKATVSWFGSPRATGYNVKRATVTYVINVSFDSTDPVKAEQIANAFADKYLSEQLEAKFEATLKPIAKLALSAAGQPLLDFNSFFTHILAHEMSHGIGPHQMTVSGKQTTPRQELQVSVMHGDGSKSSFTARVRIDTLNELEYFRHGGILNYVLRNLAA